MRCQQDNEKAAEGSRLYQRDRAIAITTVQYRPELRRKAMLRLQCREARHICVIGADSLIYPAIYKQATERKARRTTKVRAAVCTAV